MPARSSAEDHRVLDADARAPGKRRPPGRDPTPTTPADRPRAPRSTSAWSPATRNSKISRQRAPGTSSTVTRTGRSNEAAPKSSRCTSATRSNASPSSERAITTLTAATGIQRPAHPVCEPERLVDQQRAGGAGPVAWTRGRRLDHDVGTLEGRQGELGNDVHLPTISAARRSSTRLRAARLRGSVLPRRLTHRSKVPRLDSSRCTRSCWLPRAIGSTRARRLSWSAAELSVLLTAAGSDPGSIEPLDLAGVSYLGLDVAADDVCGARTGPCLRRAGRVRTGRRSAQTGRSATPGPLRRRPGDQFRSTQAKTNEQFTRLLINVTLAAQGRHQPGPVTILDPLSGRGTTLSTAWTLGHHAYGVEADPKSVEAQATFLRTYLRRKRIKHRVTSTPVRRDGRNLGRRWRPPTRCSRRTAGQELKLAVFTGDTRDSATLFGKKQFDAVVSDAPYGVVHGSATRDPKTAKRGRDRSAAELLAEAIPVWASQLKPGGSLGLSWNTYGLRREDLADIARGAGLEPLNEGPSAPFRPSGGLLDPPRRVHRQSPTQHVGERAHNNVGDRSCGGAPSCLPTERAAMPHRGSCVEIGSRARSRASTHSEREPITMSTCATC